MSRDDGLMVEVLGKRIDALHALISGALRVLMPVERYETRRQIFQTGTADGSGNLTLNLGSPPLGCAWYVERINVHAGAGTPTWSVFVGPQAQSATDAMQTYNRQDWSAAAQDNVSDQSSPIWVDVGQYLTIRAAGATASTAIVANCQVRVHRVGSPALV